MAQRAISKQEAKWRAEDDARTLMRAEEVRQDRARMHKAQQAAQQLATEKQKEAQAAKKVAKRGK